MKKYIAFVIIGLIILFGVGFLAFAILWFSYDLKLLNRAVETIFEPLTKIDPNRPKMPIKVHLIAPADIAKLDCSKTEAVDRGVEKTESVAQAALKSLLEPLSSAETEIGYTTAIPEGTKLLSVNLKDGILTANFSQEIGRGGGSCRIQGTTSQIENTLKQFSTIKEINILVDGEPAEISLQP